jgi:DNA-binding transcriptional LysR family regulator
MDWDKLRIFHAVAKAGSFTHAGETLHLSQSAVSRQIAALERDLQVPLFNRHARGLVLTEQGELLYHTAQEVLAKLEATTASLTDSRVQPFGDLRVTTTVGLGSAWLTPRILDFTRLYPDIKLHLLLSNEELDLSTRQADIAIRLRRPVQQGLIQRKLFTVHYHIYASTVYLKEHGTPHSLEELDNHRIMTFGQAPDYLKDVNWLATAGRSGQSPRESVLCIDNIYGLTRAVEAGIGIALLPDYIIDETSRLVPILTDIETPVFDTYFVYTEEMRQSKRVTVFRDFLFSTARGWTF